ncbi:MAG TPA: VanZ family protein [Thermoanaerobaculia bacterium]|nr:VanZ family protein [Thermoanaerobaculia bacterium]
MNGPPGSAQPSPHGSAHRLSHGPALGAALRRHAPAALATLLIGAALLVTGEAVVGLLVALGWTALLPLAEELFGAPVEAGGDKLVHVALFAVHAATLVRSFEAVLGAGARALSLAAGLSLLYGGVLELLQGALGRHADPWDLLADAIGVGLCVAWRLARRAG